MCCDPATDGRCNCVPYMCCWYTPRHRFFLTSEEEIEMLERYKKELEKEIQGVEQKIKELRG
ncbi:MAG: hypothetical protein ACE5KV_04385 [Thermoplasmata archaeon]